MKIAMSSYSGYGFWIAHRLQAEGHKVDCYLSQHEFANIMGGIIPPPKIVDGRGAYKSIRYDRYDVSLFDITGRERQAEFSASLCPTLGDGSFNCELEDNRQFGIELMEQAGIMVPPYQKFDNPQEAKAFVKSTGKRYVFKPDEGQEQDPETTYVSCDAEDMLKYLDSAFKEAHGKSFILQEFVEGTEISVEGWFNGQDFYLLNMTLEEKKFMNDNKGPNTGCSGNLVCVFAGEPLVYKHGLAKMKPFLNSIGYTGMLDLNSIVTPRGLYGLEFTPRFGYDAAATFLCCYAGNVGEMVSRIATGQVPEQSWRAEYAASIRLSIPPYPTEIGGKHPAGISITGIEEEDCAEIYLYDAMCEKGELVTAGHTGFVAAPIGTGNSITEAFDCCEDKIKRIKIPQMQLRTDICKSVCKKYSKLDLDGWLR